MAGRIRCIAGVLCPNASDTPDKASVVPTEMIRLRINDRENNAIGPRTASIVARVDRSTARLVRFPLKNFFRWKIFVGRSVRAGRDETYLVLRPAIAWRADALPSIKKQVRFGRSLLNCRNCNREVCSLQDLSGNREFFAVTYHAGEMARRYSAPGKTAPT
jgi:hypothetical protein